MKKMIKSAKKKWYHGYEELILKLCLAVGATTVAAASIMGIIQEKIPKKKVCVVQGEKSVRCLLIL